MSNDQEFEQRAQASWESEQEDLRNARRFIRVANEGYMPGWRAEQARERAQEVMGEPLAIDRETIVTITLGTGGPACGYEFTLDSDGGVVSGRYWYQDWFQPKRYFHLDSDEIEDVMQAYDLYLGE